LTLAIPNYLTPIGALSFESARHGHNVEGRIEDEEVFEGRD
jgi:hypothetical protein